MSTTTADLSSLRTESRNFYVWMAGAFLLVAFGGFFPTYWARVSAGTFHAPPIIHIHGMLMFSWVCFYFIQTALVRNGRIQNHRAWGLAGISLFSVMLCSILVGVMAVLRENDANGTGDAARRFAAVTLCAWPLMAGIFTLAIANVRRPETHKRLMVLLMSGMMTPAIARVFLTLLAPPGAGNSPPPPFVSGPPALVADLFIVAAMIYDWRTRGRPHRVYVIGGLVLLAQQILTIPFASTELWMNIAHSFQRLAG
jgi:hypothetical protein